MFQILLISHGDLAKEMLGACEMILGSQEGVHTLGLRSGTDLDGFGALLREQMDKIDSDDGVLVFADLYGGTPCNAAVLNILSRYEKAELISGMNLSMVLEAVAMQSGPLSAAVAELPGIGRGNVLNMREQLRKEAAENAEADE